MLTGKRYQRCIPELRVYFKIKQLHRQERKIPHFTPLTAAPMCASGLSVTTASPCPCSVLEVPVQASSISVPLFRVRSPCSDLHFLTPSQPDLRLTLRKALPWLIWINILLQSAKAELALVTLVPVAICTGAVPGSHLAMLLPSVHSWGQEDSLLQSSGCAFIRRNCSVPAETLLRNAQHLCCGFSLYRKFSLAFQFRLVLVHKITETLLSIPKSTFASESNYQVHFCVLSLDPSPWQSIDS